MERAFCYFWKHSRHRVFPFFGLHLGEPDHVAAVRGELSVEEEVHEVDLPDDVDKVEHFADEETVGVVLVCVEIGGEVIHEKFLAVVLALFVNDGAVEVEDEHLDAASLPGLPQVAGHVEQDGLEEQHETHPLIVLVVAHLVLPVHVGRHPGLHDVLAHAAHQPVGDGERGVDPAVGVHHVEGDLVHDAVNGIPDVLARGHQQGEGHQDDDGGLVVQSEDIVVDAYRVEFEKPLDGAKHVKHGVSCWGPGGAVRDCRSGTDLLSEH